ncbi:MAG: hypothetical protein HQ521_04505 [Bacteroidetes bacterium]|nr:hypothetical protein [Bacteroidota bacterium]
MKMLKKILIVVIGLSLFCGCSKTVTEPLKVDFLGEYKNVIQGIDSKCEEPYNCRVIVDFKGTGTPLMNFSGTFEFCGCGSDGEYAPTESYMVATNGDTLIVSCSGKVVEGRLDDHPEHVTSYWRDPFVILGGTGQFEGATGNGMTDDYNSSEDANSHHHWEGTITMKKGE